MNLVIRASAGTGKTFSLATRFIRLMVLEGVAPERIVALTFSRAAAQEIYVKLLERLWKAAASDAGAAFERSLLLQGCDARQRREIDHRNVDWSARGFASVLRRVLDAQQGHTIATLDSFILRIVRSFPLEMGFQNAVEVIDTYGSRSAESRAVSELLADCDGGEDLMSDVRAAMPDSYLRSCGPEIAKVLGRWRSFVEQRPEAIRWTFGSMSRVLGVADEPVFPDLSVVPATGKKGDLLTSAVAFLESFGKGSRKWPGNKGVELLVFLHAHPGETVWSYATETGRTKTCDCGAAGAAALRAGVRYVLGVSLREQLRKVVAQLHLCALVEAEYNRETRRRGQLTFTDFTRCQALNEKDPQRGLQLENVQYRFDERFDHWALDEFQDTSEMQWACLRRLVLEAAEAGAGQSVMVVGDLKQSIYTWRGGNDAPFLEVLENPLFAHQWNSVSYRYEKHTADFVNAVFGPANLARPGGVLEGHCSRGVEKWLSENCWMDHRPDSRADGTSRDGDFVEVVSVPKEDGASASAALDEDEEEEDGNSRCTAAMRTLSPNICRLVQDLWTRRVSAGSSDTVGILVRNNADGAYLAEQLRALPGGGVPVVWEGEDGVLDTPVVRGVLELLRLAVHPEDRFAWSVVNRLLPIREHVFPGASSPASVSASVSRGLSHQGLARTLRQVVSALTQPQVGLSPRSRARLEQLVREGVNFEHRREDVTSVEAFIAYLRLVAGRELASSPHVVRILTIHRAKGLTLDHVVVPILEQGTRHSVVRPRASAALAGEGWALGALPKNVVDLLPAGPVREAYDRLADGQLLESLRTYYVALTRARKSTYVFAVEDEHKGVVQFRDILRQAVASDGSEKTGYGSVIYRAGRVPAFGQREASVQEHTPWQHAAGPLPPRRRTPSAAYGPSESEGAPAVASVFFRADAGAAAARGERWHDRWAALAWIDPAQPKDDEERAILASPWREAFVRPSAEAQVWRERAYERLVGNSWETGRFDRVVFAGGRAVIYDYKTTAQRAGEDEAAFVARVRRSGEAQLRDYAAALSALTGLPSECVSCRILALEGRRVIAL